MGSAEIVKPSTSPSDPPAGLAPGRPGVPQSSAVKPPFVVIREATCGAYPIPCRARLVVQVDDDGLVPVVYFGYPEGDPRRHGRALPETALPYIVQCRVHHYGMRGKLLKGRFGLAACNDACTRSDGADCRCKCGGLHHGEDA